MKKLVFAVFGILLISAITYASNETPNFTDNQINGRMWTILNDSDKLYYIVGLTEGINFCSSGVNITFNTGDINPEVSKRVLSNLGHFITGENNKKMVEAIDNFYKDTLNLDIPVTAAYQVFVGDFKGFFDEKGRKEFIENCRRFAENNKKNK